MTTKFWQTTVQCARCKEEQLVDQPGHQPPGWVIVAYTESKFDPKQPTAPPQVFLVPYPFCGPVCAALFTLTRAWASLRTQDEKAEFKETLRGIKWWREVLDAYGDVDEDPN